MKAIETEELKKHFDDVKAVDGISITAERGDIVSLLGPNGAGKTTTINILSTQTVPDEGTASISGFDTQTTPDEVRKRIGITFQETSIDTALTGRQVLNFSGELYGMKRRDIQSKAEELLRMVELTEAADRKTKTYSGGMKRRLELARSLMNSPEVLILDEPTLGVDPQTRTKIWEYINGLKTSAGMTILMTTHYMDEAEKLSDYVYIIDNGVIAEEGKPNDLIGKQGKNTVRILGKGDAEKLSALLRERSWIQSVSSSGDDILYLGVDSGQQRAPEILKAADENNFIVSEVEIMKPNLGDVFFSVTGREIRD